VLAPIHHRRRIGERLGKLFSLKEWVTVAEAGRYLSISLSEEVTEADVLRLALDGHLRLSVNIVNGATVRRGKIVRYSDDELKAAVASGSYPQDLKWTEFPADLMRSATHGKFPGNDVTTYTMCMSLKIGPESYLTLDDEVSSVSGVWDLPMIGGERLDIEHAYYGDIGGPEITSVSIDGAFIGKEGTEVMCQLQEDYEDNKYAGGSKADLESLKEDGDLDNINEEQKGALLNAYKKRREKFLEDRKNKPRKDHFYPAGGLPNDAVIVVRTSALRDFEQSLGVPSAQSKEKTLSSRERDTLLTLIIAMAKEGYKYNPGAAKNPAVPEIVADVQRVGLSISDQTVRDKLKEAVALLPGSSPKT